MKKIDSIKTSKRDIGTALRWIVDNRIQKTAHVNFLSFLFLIDFLRSVTKNQSYGCASFTKTVQDMSSLRSFFRLSRRQRWNIKIFACLILLAFAIPRAFYNPQGPDRHTNRDDRQLPQTKLILVYGPPIPHEPWGPKTPEEAEAYKFTDWDGTPCEETRCQITFEKKLLPFSHAVLVHNSWPLKSDIPFNEEISRNRPLTQRWVFYTKESPGNMPLSTKFNGFFNWTATYRRDADFLVPYGSYAPLKVGERNEIQADSLEYNDLQSVDSAEINYAEGKDKMALFGVSNHCGGQRFDLIRALMKHINITFFGRCAHHFESDNTIYCPRSIGERCEVEIKRHKFYLAFENSLCIDYFTEKYWRNSLERGLLPVVYSAARYSSDEAIPGSFINVADFDSIEALADYLKYLDKNDTAYNQYFSWKTKYKVVKPTFWLCQLCQALHDPSKTTKVYYNISHYWGVKGACEINKDHYYALINHA